MPVIAIAHRARLEDAAIQADLKGAVGQALARQVIAFAVDAEAQPVAQELHPGGMTRLALHENEVMVRILVQAPAVDAVPGRIGIGRYRRARTGRLRLFEDLGECRRSQDFIRNLFTEKKLGPVALDEAGVELGGGEGTAPRPAPPEGDSWPWGGE